MMLFDVLAAVDAFRASPTAAAVLAFCLLGMKTWIFPERQESQVSQVQVVPQHVQLPMLELFPDCWEHNRVDLARISGKIGVPHSIMASDPVGEERITQAAAAASSDLRTRSGEEETNLEKKWSPPTKKCQRGVRKELGGQAPVVLL